MSDQKTYHVTYSPEDGEYVATCAEFPSLSWLAPTAVAALDGLKNMIDGAIAEMRANGALDWFVVKQGSPYYQAYYQAV